MVRPHRFDRTESGIFVPATNDNFVKKRDRYRVNEFGSSWGSVVASHQDSAQAGAPLGRTLQKIADALGCTVGDFAGDRSGAVKPSGAELLRLWERLPDEAARRQVLAIARALAK